MAITGVRDPKESPAQQREIGRVSCAPVTAEIFRKVAKHLGWTLDQLLVAMLEDWVPQHTSLVLEHAPAPEDERRTAERRGTKRPVPGSSHEKIDRRKSKDRRAK